MNPKKKIIEPKKKANSLKTIGGALLLISFITQNFLYDYWNEKSSEYISANRDYSEMGRSSLLYLNLYFNTDLENDVMENEVKSQYINQSAKKYAEGKAVEIAIRDTSVAVKTNLINALLNESKSVKDYDSYLNYLNFVNKTDTYNLKNKINRLEKINNYRDFFRWIFLLAYIVGSYVLLKGIKYE